MSSDVVPRETERRFDIFARLLGEWQPAVNLISPATLVDLRRRHIADCYQLAELEASATHWVDLGSGAGLPGLIVACRPDLPAVTLVESDARKCAFLRVASKALEIHALVQEGRIERLAPALDAEVVTARALAPLPRLLELATPILEKGAVGLFPKGKTFAAELTEASRHWRFEADVIPSRTDPSARVLRISHFEGRLRGPRTAT